MRTLLILAGIVFFVCMLYKTTTFHVPDPSELKTLTGAVTQIEEIPYERRKQKWHIHITISQDGVTRTLISYHASLLTQLKKGDLIKVGIYRYDDENELWTLQGDSIPSIYISDTMHVRKELIGYFHYFAYVFAVYLIYAVITGKELQREYD